MSWNTFFNSVVGRYSFVQHRHTSVNQCRLTWRCTRCWRSKRVWNSSLDRQPCALLRLAMQRVKDAQQSHQLFACAVNRSEECLVFCAACGSYLDKQARGLQAPCEPGLAARRGRKTVLKRLSQGRHPKLHWLPVWVPWPVAVGA